MTVTSTFVLLFYLLSMTCIVDARWHQHDHRWMLLRRGPYKSDWPDTSFFIFLFFDFGRSLFRSFGRTSSITGVPVKPTRCRGVGGGGSTVHEGVANVCPEAHVAEDARCWSHLVGANKAEHPLGMDAKTVRRPSGLLVKCLMYDQFICAGGTNASNGERLFAHTNC